MKFFRFLKAFDVSSEIQNAYNDYFKECGYKQPAAELTELKTQETIEEVPTHINKTEPVESVQLITP